jgi:hypothetical protein
VPESVVEITVFVASPGDVARERRALVAVAEEVDRTVGVPEGFRLSLKRWESHARPAAGRPQGVVNAQLGPADVFVGLLWGRFGTPTGKAASGTEEEFLRAHAAWTRGGTHRPEILLYFSEARLRPSDVDPAQLARVQDFRARVERDHLVWTYPGAARFADVVRPHLIDAARAALRRVRGASPAPPRARPPRLSRRYSDAEREAYLAHAFGVVRRYVATAAGALAAHVPSASVTVKLLAAGDLYAEGAVDGLVRSRCRIWTQPHAVVYGGSLYQSEASDAVKIDGLAVLKEVDGALVFTLRGFRGGAHFGLSAEEVAERLWWRFVRRLEV